MAHSKIIFVQTLDYYCSISLAIDVKSNLKEIDVIAGNWLIQFRICDTERLGFISHGV